MSGSIRWGPAPFEGSAEAAAAPLGPQAGGWLVGRALGGPSPSCAILPKKRMDRRIVLNLVSSEAAAELRPRYLKASILSGGPQNLAIQQRVII